MKIKIDIIVEGNGSVSCYMVSIVEILCVLKGKSKLTKFVVNFLHHLHVADLFRFNLAMFILYFLLNSVYL